MGVQVPPPPAPPTRSPGPFKRAKNFFNPKKAMNRAASKALEAADVVLGSIPAAHVASEIKDVALIAIKKD